MQTFIAHKDKLIKPGNKMLLVLQNLLQFYLIDELYDEINTLIIPELYDLLIQMLIPNTLHPSKLLSHFAFNSSVQIQTFTNTTIGHRYNNNKYGVLCNYLPHDSNIINLTIQFNSFILRHLQHLHEVGFTE